MADLDEVSTEIHIVLGYDPNLDRITVNWEGSNPAMAREIVRMAYSVVCDYQVDLVEDD